MQANSRITMVDALRGYALLGLFLVHCVERFELHWLEPKPGFWFDAVFALFSGKAFAIFALLFGFSFATIMANERARGGDFTLRFAWRLTLLFAIGTIHALVYRGDILQVLALAGLILIPFDRVKSDRFLLVLAALLFLQLPLLLRAWAAVHGAAWAQANPLFFGDSNLAALAYGSFGEVLAANAGPGMASKWSYYLETGRMVEIAGLFLLGMVIQRRGWFADARRHQAGWLVALGSSAALWALAAWAGPSMLPAGPDAGGTPMVRQSFESAVDQWRALGATGFQVALFVLMWLGPLRVLLGWLAAPGKMTLTLYVGQSFVAGPLLYGFGLGLWDDLSQRQLAFAGVLLFAAQAAVAALWFRAYRYGPLEWLWRAATRTTLSVPFRQT
jgi:uncharacterized protein